MLLFNRLTRSQLLYCYGFYRIKNFHADSRMWRWVHSSYQTIISKNAWHQDLSWPIWWQLYFFQPLSENMLTYSFRQLPKTSAAVSPVSGKEILPGLFLPIELTSLYFRHCSGHTLINLSWNLSSLSVFVAQFQHLLLTPQNFVALCNNVLIRSCLSDWNAAIKVSALFGWYTFPVNRKFQRHIDSLTSERSTKVTDICSSF